VRGSWRARVSRVGPLAWLFIAFNVTVAILAWREYQSLLDYCEGENRATGGSGLDCLEGYSWPAISLALFAWFFVAVLLGGAALAERRRRAGRPAAPIVKGLAVFVACTLLVAALLPVVLLTAAS
jgi:hypothetical protein